MSILDDIIIKKKEEVQLRKKNHPFSEIRKGLRTETRDFKGALQQPEISLITEIKRKSPSKGMIREDFHPVSIARTYQANGASALSVLTDESFFGGCSEYLTQARAATELPVLRKDFIIDAYQIAEARHIGADAVLLIAACIDRYQMTAFIQYAKDLGMACLVEVHSKKELEEVLRTPAEIIGINNRNLATFEVTLATSLNLKELIPDSIVTVSESGIHTRDDVDVLESAGFDALLIGESLMKSENIGVRLQELLGEHV